MVVDDGAPGGLSVQHVSAPPSLAGLLVAFGTNPNTDTAGAVAGYLAGRADLPDGQSVATITARLLAWCPDGDGSTH